MQRPVNLFLPLLAQKRLQRQQQRFLPFVHFSRLPQHCGGRLRQRLLPRSIDTGDLLMLLILLLLVVDGEEEDQLSVILTAAAFLLS